MTVSMRVMSAGRNYQYLLKSVVSGDGNPCRPPLTRYYTEEATPPGRWLGSGLHAVGDGTLNTSDPVIEEQLARHCCIEPSCEAGTTDLPVGSTRQVPDAPSGPPK